MVRLQGLAIHKSVGLLPCVCFFFFLLLPSWTFFVVYIPFCNQVMACVCARACVCVSQTWMKHTKLDGQGLLCRSTQCSGFVSLAAAHAGMHAKQKCVLCRGTAIFSYTSIGKSAFVFSICFLFSFSFSFFFKIKTALVACCFPTIHGLTVWFMNIMTWPGPLRKMGVDEGVLEVRRAVGELLLQSSRHVWRLRPDNSVAASSHENFPGGRGRCATQPQYLMKNLSEVAIRTCYIR